MSQIINLKIKLKSLAAESVIIKQQERKHRGPNWGWKSNRLREHRIHVVRVEARCTHLAYGFLKGKALIEIEQTSKSEPDWNKVERMVRRYGSSTEQNALKAWRTR